MRESLIDAFLRFLAEKGVEKVRPTAVKRPEFYQSGNLFYTGEQDGEEILFTLEVGTSLVKTGNDVYGEVPVRVYFMESEVVHRGHTFPVYRVRKYALTTNEEAVSCELWLEDRLVRELSVDNVRNQYERAYGWGELY